MSETIGLGQIALDGHDIYWVEARPAEAGRNVIVRCGRDGKIADVTPAPFSARTRVHEYGGGAFAVDKGVVFFSNDADQCLYRQDLGATPKPITAAGNRRYADGTIDHRRGRVICVCEDHASGGEPDNTIAVVDLAGAGSVRELIAGADFYAAPRLSPDGRRLAWLSWNHPNMPWDGTDLWVADLQTDGSLAAAKHVAGGASESIFQPEWSPDSNLYFVSDRSGWWNLYRWRGGHNEALVQMQAEFGLPQWAFAMSTYAFVSAERIICAYTEHGIWHLAAIDTATGGFARVDTAYTYITGLRAVARHVCFVAGSPAEGNAVVRLNIDSGNFDVLRRSSTVSIDDDYLSLPREVTFPTANGLTAHGFFYPPCNHAYAPPEGTKPPLIVGCHGGPTGATSTPLNLKTQYWSSRGFALFLVNYGGSTGYGRAYRERLNGRWGIVDVDDCVNAVRSLVAETRVNNQCVAISGGSAGGYTVLCALTFHDVFTAGASYYGVSDLEALAKDTHKFESRYLDRLVGAYPQQRARYRERSPIHFSERLSCPVIFFQGLEDRVVPPNQAERMVQALRRKGLPVAYLPVAEEQHGFRKAENIKRALDAELYFYSRIFGFELAQAVEPVVIENL